jgi:ABC-type transport system involved in multi-copper enzyme maturation permease subunit
VTKNVWLFAGKEIADGFLSFRVPASLVLVLILFTSISFTLAERYEDTFADYQGRVEQNEAALKRTQTYSDIRIPIEKPPSPLMLFNIGLSETVSNSFVITRLGYPEISDITQNSGSLLQIFPSFDLSLVVQIVFGLLALVFSYAGIAGEKEQGTLKLVCSNTVSRSEILLGKILGNFLILEALLAVGFGIFMFVVRFFSGIALTSDAWIRIAWIFLAASLYTALIYLIGIFISSRSSRSSIALVASMFFWIAQVAILPLTVNYFVGTFNPVTVEPRNISINPLGASSMYRKVLDALMKEKAGPRGMSFSSSGGLSMSGLTDRGREIVRQFIPEWVRAQEEESKADWNRLETTRRKLERQESIAMWIKLVSPAFVFDRLSATLAGTGAHNYRRFRNDLLDYRQQISLWLRNENAYESPKFFDSDAGPIDVTTLPRFDIPRALRWQADVQSSLPWLAGLAIAGVVFFLLSFFSFIRFDIR